MSGLRGWSGGEAGHGGTGARVRAVAIATFDSIRSDPRFRQIIAEDDVAERRTAVYRPLEAVEVVDVGRPVLRRASEPFSTALGTLDAMYLATAMAWRDARGAELTLATHDKALATAARAAGMPVIGA